MDAGVADNLAVNSLTDFLKSINDNGKQNNIPHVLIIVADAEIPARQPSVADPDPRSFWEHFSFVDTNFRDTYDTLMSEIKQTRIGDLTKEIKKAGGKLMHLKFPSLNPNQEDYPCDCKDDNKCMKAYSPDDKDKDHPCIYPDETIDSNNVYAVVSDIQTSFQIDDNQANCLRHAARILVREEVSKLRKDPYWQSIIVDPKEVEKLPVCKLPCRKKLCPKENQESVPDKITCNIKD
jgi:hypothetical protein